MDNPRPIGLLHPFTPRDTALTRVVQPTLKLEGHQRAIAEVVLVLIGPGLQRRNKINKKKNEKNNENMRR